MSIQHQQEQAIIEKIRALPPERVAGVEDFLDCLRVRNDDRRLTRTATKLSEKAFQKNLGQPGRR